ncbi:MAG: hypothetical protein NT001_03445 [Candidatus Woesearchaeota archaeon]|nr:hypothetical protein [Candidatus Woesearchaeota archaeon]
MSITIQPKPDNEYRTQDQWISFFNEKKQKMISAPDVYNLVQESSTEAIESLRTDFRDMWLVTSTRIIYSKDNLKATIIHDADSIATKPKEYKNILIPEMSGDFREDKQTEAYLQALFGTKDNIKKILAALKEISGKDTIRLWTPSQHSRSEQQIRSVCLNFDDLGRFSVYGVSWFDDYDGCSHGVSSSGPSPKARSEFKSEKFSEEEIYNDCKTDPSKAIAKMMYNDRYQKKR